MPAADAIRALRERLATVADLESLAGLAAWDQRTKMPSGAAAARAEQLATVDRLLHELMTASEVGEWLDEIEASSEELDPIDRDIARIARRDWERLCLVSAELAAERTRAAVVAEDVWQEARTTGDFAAFAPALRRNVELAREYAACFDGGATPYDELLADYDHGLTAARLRELFGRLTEELPAIVAEAAARPRPADLAVPVAAQRAAVAGTLRRVGAHESGLRLDVSAHPFSVTIAPTDSRVTVRYEEAGAGPVIEALHEFGHGLYERQIGAELVRTNLQAGTSTSVHESQSKLWENHIGRHPAFATVLAQELGRGGFDVDPADVHATLVCVKPSPIRVTADEVTYPLHVVARFGVELALIEGSLDVADLPEAFDESLRRLLGVAPPDPASGVLQDVHWAMGAFGYFPGYALGCLIAAQLWETIEQELGPQDDALRAGELDGVREWLGERVHRFGRRLDTEPLVEQATGRPLEVEPFLRHVRRVAGV